MDRVKYLELCRVCAVLPEKYCVKSNIPKHAIIAYQGKEYYPVSYVLAFDNKGEAIHSCILHDLKVNSTIQVKLERI